MKKLIYSLLMVITLSALLIGCSNGEGDAKGASDGEKITLRIGSGHTIEGGTWTEETANFFIPEVNKRLEDTDYEIEWIESYGGSVASLGENVEAVESGILDLSMVIVPFVSSDLLISNIGYNTPFGTPDPEVTAEVMVELYEKYPEFGEEYSNNGQKLLSFGVSNSYELVTSFPINSIEDLENRKIGGAGANLGWLDAAGVVPVQGGLTETYQNIQTGVYEGYIMYSRGSYGYRLHEVAPHITEVGFGSILVGVLTINEDTYNGLPAEVQEVIDEVGNELTFQIAKAAAEETESNNALMIEEGAEITPFSDEDRKAWAEAIPNQPNEYAQRLNEAGLPGTEILRDYIKLMEEKGYEFPRDYEIE